MIKAAIILAVVSGTTLHKYVSPQSEVSTNIEASVQSIVTKDYVEGLGVVPEVDFSTGNTQLVATIEATAPAPGDYATVSNRAMSAITRRHDGMIDVGDRGYLQWGASSSSLFGYYDEYSQWYLLKDDYGRLWFPVTEGEHTVATTDDVAAVSSRLDAATATNAAQTAALAGKASTNDVVLTPVYSGTPTFSEWTISPYSQNIVGLRFVEEFPQGWYPLGADGERVGLIKGDANSVNLTWSEADAIDPFTATRVRTDIIGYTLGTQTNRVMAATNALISASITNGLASVADVELMPMYGGNGERFNAWTYYNIPDGVTVVSNPSYGYSPELGHNVWKIRLGALGNEGYVINFNEESENATTIVFAASDFPIPVNITATRTENPIVGYTLGDQTDSVLASTNMQTGVSAATVTNIVRDLSLGGIWDSQLEVWWTPRMRNGSLNYEATTNVNLNAGN